MPSWHIGVGLRRGALWPPLAGRCRAVLREQHRRLYVQDRPICTTHEDVTRQKLFVPMSASVRSYVYVRRRLQPSNGYESDIDPRGT